MWGIIQSWLAEYTFLRFIAILLLVFLVARIVLWFFRKVVERQLIKAKQYVPEKVVMKLELPLLLILILSGVQIASQQINYTNNALQLLVNSAVIIIITYMFIGVMNILLNYWQQLHSRKNHEFVHGEMIPLVRSVAKIIFVIIAIVLILQLWGVQVGALVASVGIIGVILGFAFQDTMRNIFGGISISMDNSIVKGDVIQLDSGEAGEVQEINFRSTKIRTFDNDMLIIPNGIFANAKFHNFAQPNNEIRVVIPINVGYGSSVSQVREVLLDCIKDDENILTVPKREVRLMKMDDYSLKFDFIFFIGNYHERYNMINVVTEKAYNALQKNNIEIPFPTRTIHNK